MMHLIEDWFASLWNGHQQTARPPAPSPDGLLIGTALADTEENGPVVSLPQNRRTQHCVVVGKTGTGKSSLIRSMIQQDILARRGFCCIDQHHDLLPFLLAVIAAEEVRTGEDLSERVMLLDPTDPDASAGLNVLEATATQMDYTLVAECTAVLRAYCGLDSLGPRTEELLRNTLLLLAENGLTLLEAGPALVSAEFRSSLLARVTHEEVQAYFRDRYAPLSEAQQTVYREAVLNKITAFTGDPRFRHLLGQTRSTLSLTDALDHGRWVLINLDRGRLGASGATLGSLLLTRLKYALFARRSRQVFTLYCDEVQNLLAYDTGLEVLLAEARKFGLAVITANQYLDQVPPAMRAALLSVGTHILFQLAPSDADKIASAFDGGRALAETLKNLPPRTAVVKSGHEHLRQAQVPTLTVPQADIQDLVARCRRRWARPRVEIEAEIRARHAAAHPAPMVSRQQENLNDWE